MKKILISACTVLLVIGLTVQDAEAKRLGGGTSRGMQREVVTQRQATPQPTAPSHQVAPQPLPQSPAVQPQKRNWLGPLAGLAAGVGLGALFSHFGLGGGLGNLVTILLMVFAGLALFKMLSRRTQPQIEESYPLRYAGGPVEPNPPTQIHAAPQAAGASVPIMPAGFEREAFLRVAKVNFLRLQAANDAGNIDDIREFTTPEMYAELKLDMDDRGNTKQQTDVVRVEAELVDLADEPGRHVASVRFHGLVQEEKNTAAQPFDEVWHLVKPTDGSRGWLVAGIQQLG